MSNIQTVLTAKREVAERTFAFHFSKPDGFTFKPGQAIDLILPETKGEKLAHAFSLVSAPFEDELVIATRMRDTPFKQALAALLPGAAARFSGPYGKLTLPETAWRKVRGSEMR